MSTHNDNLMDELEERIVTLERHLQESHGRESELKEERATLNENLRKLGQNDLADYVQSTETITELANALREILASYENILQNEWSTTKDPEPAQDDEDCVRARKALERVSGNENPIAKIEGS